MNKKAATLILLLLVSASVAAQKTCFDLLDEDSQRFIQADEQAMAAFEGTQIGDPYYVYELSQGEDYYLVPCNKETGTTAVIKLDANQGYFEATTYMEEPTKYLPVAKSEATATIKEMINPEPIEGLAIEFDFNGGVKTRLEWQVGEYSQDPFKPYWFLQAEDGKWAIGQNANLYELSAFTSSKPDTKVTEMESVLESTEGFLVAGKFYEITNDDLDNGSFEATLTFGYLDENQDGVVDNTSINEEELNVYYFDAETMQWVLVPNPIINTEANTITVTVDHFTTFMLAAKEPEPEPPAPEPQSPGNGGGFLGTGGGGGTAKLGMKIEKNCAGKEIVVTILNPSDNPAENATVTIYTLAWKTVEEQKTNEEGKAAFVLEAGEYTVRAAKSGYMVNTKQTTVEECTAEIIEEPPMQNNGDLQETMQENQTPAAQKPQNLQQEQETPMQAGLFSLNNLLENKEEQAANAAMAGAFAAIVAGTILYLKKKRP